MGHFHFPGPRRFNLEQKVQRTAKNGLFIFLGICKFTILFFGWGACFVPPAYADDVALYPENKHRPPFPLASSRRGANKGSEETRETPAAESGTSSSPGSQAKGQTCRELLRPCRGGPVSALPWEACCVYLFRSVIRAGAANIRFRLMSLTWQKASTLTESETLG